MTHGLIGLRLEALDLAELVRELADVVLPLARGRGLTLSVSHPKGPLLIKGDPTRLEQVVANLLDNAVKYTDPGGAIELAVEVEPLSAQAVVRVRDTGQGIRPDLLPRVFELFVQADRSSGDARGLGVGLTLVRRLVELHGGSVEAHSDGPGKGSEFVSTGCRS